MQKNRRPRFRTDDLRELEELVWRDLNAAVRAANERVAAEGSGRKPLQSSEPDRAQTPVAAPAATAEPSPAGDDGGDETTSDAGIEEPASSNAAADLASQESETSPLDVSHGVVSVATLMDSTGDPTGAQWSNASDEQFLDGVAEWLNRQARPDQMIAEIWCRLLALQVPAPGLVAAVAARRFQ
jgi:hypothetical protein